MNISINELNKIYKGGKEALKDITFDIDTGMFGLLGPNGAGKTTLMRILVTLMKPSSGQIKVNELDLFKNRKEIRSYLGYLPQEFHSAVTDTSLPERPFETADTVISPGSPVDCTIATALPLKADREVPL